MDISTFLFGPYPLSLQLADKIFAVDILGALLIGVGLAVFLRLKRLNPVNHKLVSRFKNLTLFYGLTGLLWLGFRYENASYLSWRLWIVILAAVALLWFVKILVYWIARYKKDLAEWRKQEVKQKYLSKK